MTAVGSSRLLEKVVVGSLTTFLVSLKVDAGCTKAQKRSKRKVSKTWRTISIVIGGAARAQQGDALGQSRARALKVNWRSDWRGMSICFANCCMTAVFLSKRDGNAELIE